MISKQKNAERMHRKQLKAEAALLAARYPEVASIVITMDYFQKNVDHRLMQRTINIFPESSAYFLMECMRQDCTNGGFNLEPVIAAMIGKRLKTGDGELSCAGNNALGHARVNYRIDIAYNAS
ncbi:MAG: hypothetical protein OHK006_22700 [Thermodesulfovibrionales bacterium]